MHSRDVMNALVNSTYFISNFTLVVPQHPTELRSHDMTSDNKIINQAAQDKVSLLSPGLECNVEMGFLHVGQAGLKLPTSGDSLALAFQSAGITGVSHRAQQQPNFFKYLHVTYTHNEACVSDNDNRMLVLVTANPSDKPKEHLRGGYWEKMRSHYIAQADFILLVSSNLPTSASQVTWDDSEETTFRKEATEVKTRDEEEYIILPRTAYNGHLDIVRELIAQGADVHPVTVDGWMPLHSACKWNNTRVASFLLRHDAAVNARTKGLLTPLASCCWEQRQQGYPRTPPDEPLCQTRAENQLGRKSIQKVV
ncbi:Ankyrin repeat domain-containing protein 49 [Plecturocebus cupreus]